MDRPGDRRESDGPAIHYICFVPPGTGGERMNLQHVASLHAAGVRAVALVNRNAKVESLPPGLQGLPIERLAPHRRFRPDDVVVIPEFYRDAIRHFAGLGCRKVLHLQGPFLAFRGVDDPGDWRAAGIEAGIACSRFARGMAERMGAGLPWQVVAPFVHPLFQPPADGAKALQVAHMPQKRPREAPVVRALARHLHPATRDVPWVALQGLGLADCADAMAQSAVFACFSWLDGLGLPPLEAMAAGCIVCGFDGHGGSDFASPHNGLWVREGDHEGFAAAVAQALQMARLRDARWAAMLAAGAATAAAYSQHRFERELMAAWQAILGPRWDDYQKGEDGDGNKDSRAGRR